MAKAQMSSVDAAMGENSNDLERFCYSWVDLYLAENFIWISSVVPVSREAELRQMQQQSPPFAKQPASALDSKPHQPHPK
jgi:hypothetical protein